MIMARMTAVLSGLLLLMPVIADEGAYAVNPGDILGISVWKEPDLQSEVIIRPDAGITFPLVGEVDTRNKSVEQLQEEITNRLKKYIPEPVVTVAIKRLSGSRVFVIGKVRNPGMFSMDQKMDVMQALSLAGGLTPHAAEGSIKVLRRMGAAQQAFKFDYSDVEKGKLLEQNIILQSGDVVVVP